MKSLVRSDFANPRDVTRNNYRGEGLYNSFLYGNGLKVYTLFELVNSVEKVNNSGLYYNDFMKILLEASYHQRIFSYLFYNYWYCHICEELLSNRKSQNIIKNVCNKFLDQLESNDKIFTTNFDMIHDNYFNTKHLHGSFAYPLRNAMDIKYRDIDSKSFEYKFLLGTNGLEKLKRIDRFKEFSDTPFNRDLFYNNSTDYGHMLIFGLSFGRVEVMSDEFYEQYSEYEDLRLVKSVDGHIILKLELLLKQAKLTKITLSYYSETDVKNYESSFINSPLKEIIEY